MTPLGAWSNTIGFLEKSEHSGPPNFDSEFKKTFDPRLVHLSDNHLHSDTISNVPRSVMVRSKHAVLGSTHMGLYLGLSTTLILLCLCQGGCPNIHGTDNQCFTLVQLQTSDKITCTFSGIYSETFLLIQVIVLCMVHLSCNSCHKIAIELTRSRHSF